MDEKVFNLIMGSLNDLKIGNQYLSEKLALTASKDDLKDMKQEVSEQIKEVKKHLSEQDEKIDEIKSEHNENTKFRKTFISCLMWILGALITFGSSQIPNIVKAIHDVPHQVVGSVIAPLAPDDGE